MIPQKTPFKRTPIRHLQIVTHRLSFCRLEKSAYLKMFSIEALTLTWFTPLPIIVDGASIILLLTVKPVIIRLSHLSD